jgi:hypothetical protein
MGAASLPWLVRLTQDMVLYREDDIPPILLRLSLYFFIEMISSRIQVAETNYLQPGHLSRSGILMGKIVDLAIVDYR